MPRSALMVPVPEAEQAVGPIRLAHDPSASLGVPAHITIVVPWLPPNRIGSAEHDALRELFASERAFAYSLTRARRFPSTLYLAPEPEFSFVRLTERVIALWPEAPPYEGAHDRVVPHLTVAHGSDAAAFDALERRIEPALPIAARAAEAWLMEEALDDRWHLIRRFPFAR